MIRLVLAVVLAAAVLGTTLPVLEEARAGRTATLTRAELVAFVDATDRFAATSDPVPFGSGAARRTLTLRLPVVGWAGEAMTVTFDGGTGVEWRVGDRTGTVETHLPVRGVDGPLALRGGGHRLVVRYGLTPDGPVVLVRAFKDEDGTTPARVRRVRPRPAVADGPRPGWGPGQERGRDRE